MAKWDFTVYIYCIYYIQLHILHLATWWWWFVAKSCLTLETPWTVAHQASSVHGIFQARILKWVAVSFFRDLQLPRCTIFLNHFPFIGFRLFQFNMVSSAALNSFQLNLPFIHNYFLRVNSWKSCCYTLRLLVHVDKDFPAGSVVKNLPACAGGVGSISGWEDPLEEKMATYSRLLA